MSGHEIYQSARAIVAAELQAITYREFLPVLLGDRAVRPYAGYSPGVDPGIANGFAAAAYRLGHKHAPERAALPRRQSRDAQQRQPVARGRVLRPLADEPHRA